MITHLYRFPIKGMSGQKLECMTLTEKEGLAGDRSIAVARKPGSFDPATPRALPKSYFLMLMRDEQLALLDTHYDDKSGRLIIRHEDKVCLDVDLGDERGATEAEHFYRTFLADDRLTPDLIRTENHKFTDISVVSDEKARAVSLINLNSVQALADAIGKPVHHMRFRANIYFDHVPAWREFDWIDRQISIGDCCLQGVLRTRRCAATQVNPDTGERDINVPAEIKAHFGHLDMGVYAEVTQGGTLKIEDDIRTD